MFVDFTETSEWFIHSGDDTIIMYNPHVDNLLLLHGLIYTVVFVKRNLSIKRINEQLHYITILVQETESNSTNRGTEHNKVKLIE